MNPLLRGVLVAMVIEAVALLLIVLALANTVWR